MASLCNDGNGGWRILFRGTDDKRHTIRLGKMPQKQAVSIKVKVEVLNSASITGHPVDDATGRWVVNLGDWLHEKLAKAKLVEPRRAAQLGPFINAYIASRTDLKPGTLQTFRTSRDRLLDYFDADQDLRSITPEHAQAFRRHLLQKGYAENSIRGFVKKARHFYSVAIKQGLVRTSPFAELPATIGTNPELFYYVTREETAAVLEACPDDEWRLIVALARFGGVRVPTEILSLRWCDVDWVKQQVRITSPKTEHQGKPSRVIPLFPELAPHLRAVFESAPPGTPHVITRYRLRNCNLRTQFHRIIRRAGLEPWPKIFKNLRSTRETELAERFPLHVVCRWIGNTELVAAKHYLQLTDEHFQRAVQPMAVEAEMASNSAQNAAQQPSVTGSHHQQLAQKQTPQGPELTGTCGVLLRKSFSDNDLKASPRGTEHPAPNPTKTPISDQDGAQSGAPGAARAEAPLADLLARWDSLPPAMREAIRLLMQTAANEKST